ncbi:hypothetical protein T02_5638 [Trichinella nativa]|uniref:Uncharacterized protein n=1 Tax=Trichinella nativa TaxID=6335 RepID=A0A0V1LES2_9BILA|nr:hypothetical protein T02_5638 [Trichinella nativa]
MEQRKCENADGTKQNKKRQEVKVFVKQSSNEIVIANEIANAIDDVNLIVNDIVGFCYSFPSISSAYWHPDKLIIQPLIYSIFEVFQNAPPGLNACKMRHSEHNSYDL